MIPEVLQRLTCAPLLRCVLSAPQCLRSRPEIGVHARGLGASGQCQRKGLARLDRTQLLRVAHQDQAVDFQHVGEPDQPVLIAGRDHRGFVQHKHGVTISSPRVRQLGPARIPVEQLAVLP